MNLSFSEEDLKFQDEVRSFIADNYPAEIKIKWITEFLFQRTIYLHGKEF